MNDLIFILKMCVGAINILFSVELAFFAFINRDRSSKKSKEFLSSTNPTSRISIGFSLYFIFLAGSFIGYILEVREYYFSLSPDFTPNAPIMQYSSLVSIFLLFAYCAMYFTLMSRLLSKSIQFISLIFFMIVIISKFISLSIFDILLYGAIPFSLIFFILLRSLIILSSGKLRSQFYLIVLGYVLISIATITISRIFNLNLISIDSIFPEICNLIGLSFVGWGFLSIPSLYDAFAFNYVEGLYVTKNSGDIVVCSQFNNESRNVNNENIENLDNSPQMDDDAFASSIVGIDGILHEISSAQGSVKMVKHHNKILLIERSKLMIGVLITQMDLFTLRIQLQSILQTIETEYSQKLSSEPTISNELKLKLKNQINNWFNSQYEKIQNRKFIRQLLKN